MLYFSRYFGTLVGMFVVSCSLRSGRRFSMIIASLIALGAISITMIDSLWMFLIGTILLGCADSIGTNAKYRFIEEYVPQNYIA